MDETSQNVLNHLISLLPDLFGPVLIGSLVAALLVGIQLNQTVAYHSRFGNDRLDHKVIVYFLALNSAISWANVVVVAWQLFIDLITDPKRLLHATPRNWSIVFVSPVIATAFSQYFFSLRAYIVSSRSRILGWILSLCWLIHLGLGIASVALASTVDGATRGNGIVPDATRRMTAISLVFGAAYDVLLTMILVVHLAKNGRKGKHASTLSRFARLTLTTGLLNSALEVAATISGFALANQSRLATVSVPFAYARPPIISICVLGTLLFRDPRKMMEAELSLPSSKKRHSLEEYTTSDDKGEYDLETTIMSTFTPSSKYGANLRKRLSTTRISKRETYRSEDFGTDSVAAAPSSRYVVLMSRENLNGPTSAANAPAPATMPPWSAPDVSTVSFPPPARRQSVRGPDDLPTPIRKMSFSSQRSSTSIADLPWAASDVPPVPPLPDGRGHRPYVTVDTSSVASGTPRTSLSSNHPPWRREDLPPLPSQPPAFTAGSAPPEWTTRQWMDDVSASPVSSVSTRKSPGGPRRMHS